MTTATTHGAFSPNMARPTHSTSADETTHSLLVGYLLWIFGFTGAHRFYFGKPVSGTIYFFTFGLFLVGWFIDLFLIPSLREGAKQRYNSGEYNYTFGWVLLTFLGWAGIHNFYLGQYLKGAIMLLFAVASPVVWPLAVIPLAVYLYDYWSLNEQISQLNRT